MHNKELHKECPYPQKYGHSIEGYDFNIMMFWYPTLGYTLCDNKLNNMIDDEPKGIVQVARDRDGQCANFGSIGFSIGFLTFFKISIGFSIGFLT